MKANFDFEVKYWQQGIKLIAGVDEAGRGPLAGPVVAAAVILKPDFNHPEVFDSKALSKKKREALKDLIEKEALAIGVGIVSEKEIDKINILEAARLAMLKAIKDLKIKPEFILTDFMKLPDLPHEAIVKGDQKSTSIAAASIIAKVTRDEIMKKYDEIYPHYDFKNNQGYGTKKHLEALEKNGVSPIHRTTFNPVSIYIRKQE
ncbi:ribonuclease HII [Acholeplasma equirhinis]|uniref:ribonuclease HII n=1 Tax=Acholeplasma equirhinis TaxID=555393 RepID=UPI00197AA0F5|nr:ribonuclease HII [Acholeplasma equirhinis]MBN3490674.1 ribonuclease HII [Acholeplasma equirhinis]